MSADLILPMWAITLVFFGIALAYSSVGLGGGSSYIAMMVILGFSSAVIPPLSLVLNLLVTSIGSVNFIRRGHLRLRLILPFVVTSIPAAWLGGAIKVSPMAFQWLLLLSLLVVIYRIYFWRDTAFKFELSGKQQIGVSLLAGGVLGLLAGIVGIGGGIYLVPLILVLGLGTVQEAAACGAVFIWLNSAVGLASRLQHNFIDITPYWQLLVAVLIGGFLGSFLGAFKLPTKIMEKVLGGVIVVAVFFLVRSLVS